MLPSHPHAGRGPGPATPASLSPLTEAFGAFTSVLLTIPLAHALISQVLDTFLEREKLKQRVGARG